jgi:hypothetical protein
LLSFLTENLEFADKKHNFCSKSVILYSYVNNQIRR